MFTVVGKSLIGKYLNGIRDICASSLIVDKIAERSCREANKFGWLNGGKQIRCKSYNRFLDRSKVPTLDEIDLEEQYVRGSGPGGQATNKTSNAVVLKHKPTGLVVKCHETRSLPRNREIARETLLRKLDNKINGEDSLENQEARLRKRDSIKKKQKRKKLSELKKQFEKRENIK